MTDYTKLVEALRFCARWHRADDALANAEQAADAIERLTAERDEAKTDLAAVGRAFIREIEQHEPKRGEWVEENRRPRSSQFVCSECHRTAYDPQPTRDKAWRKRCRYAYCPNCGAKMEVQDG